MLFGSKTEKTSQVIGAEEPGDVAEAAEPETNGVKEPRPKQPGHGRNPAAALVGAKSRGAAPVIAPRRLLPRVRQGQGVSTR